MKLLRHLRSGTRVLGSLVASATLLLALAAPMSAQEGGCAPSGDGGWVNLPGSVDGLLRDQRGIGIMLTGRSVRDLDGRPVGPDAKFIVQGRAGLLIGAFDAGVDLVNFARGDSAAIHVGAGFAGGIGVIHAQGLPLVAFKADGGLMDLPVDVLVMLAGMGQANLQISFVNPEFTRVTTLDLGVILPSEGRTAALTFRSSMR